MGINIVCDEGRGEQNAKVRNQSLLMASIDGICWKQVDVPDGYFSLLLIGFAETLVSLV